MMEINNDTQMALSSLELVNTAALELHAVLYSLPKEHKTVPWWDSRNRQLQTCYIICFCCVIEKKHMHQHDQCEHL